TDFRDCVKTSLGSDRIRSLEQDSVVPPGTKSFTDEAVPGLKSWATVTPSLPGRGPETRFHTVSTAGGILEKSPGSPVQAGPEASTDLRRSDSGGVARIASAGWNRSFNRRRWDSWGGGSDGLSL